ncbi:MAG: tetratricopeptide repeat protein [Chthoniobacterales bacterium]|nr:tetratricopeptide repeat protein [Chthoniobacterales bacterium]
MQRESPPLAAAAAIPAEEAATDSAIRFYAARVKRDPEDTRSQNALAEYYLQRVRETGNEDYLPLAITAARASIKAVIALRNLGGLTALAHAEFANHAFAAAREHALKLIQIDPSKSEPYAILGDVSLELGDYEAAADAFQKMQTLQEKNAGSETRLARLAILQGATKEARIHFEAALALLLALPQPPNETVAWCRWQLGETAFAGGDYATAEKHYREALKDAPSYFRALGSMGRVRAARHDFPAAISYYEEAVRIVPVVEFMAALGDLYQLSGRTRDAAIRYELVEQLGDHSRKVHGTPYDRRIALFLADHDRKLEQAYALARGEFDAGRHDIYGADALAWTALKFGRVAEAQAASREALRLGTLDAKLFYHAGLIARAAGDEARASSLLRRALTLNPEFDPLQSAIAQKAQKEK